ncbi:MAG: uracil-DNA glycosylase, partial [Candidatus Zixiibacteriota bacterium]
MSEDSADIRNLVRRALKAQIELGTEEVILSRKARTEPKKLPAVTIVRPAESIAAPESLFGAETPTRGLKSPLGPATYGSIESHCDTIKTCMKCPLGATRNKFVYGVGNPNARLMFIGEAPGAQEDAQGEPFVGAAGQLLDKIMAAIQLSRKDVFIANILKCRPPNNRDPQP